VGIIAAQSIGEPATQMTLNSVSWDTRIIIAKNGKIQTPQIGQFIDDYYMNLKQKATEGDAVSAARIQTLPNNQIYIELDDGHEWQAVSCGDDGVVKWTKLEAITRHPVINEDGSNTILEVETDSGRILRATKALSFLTRSEEDKVIGIKGSDLKVGTVLPITSSLALNQLPSITEISLRSILPPTEWLYGTDVMTALATMKAADAAGKRHWFGTTNGLIFTVPYNRSDSFREAFAKGHNTNASSIKPGFVYTKKMMKGVSQIPESIPLTREFGYFVGAYLAEGMSNDTQINITNNDFNYLEPIKTLMDSWCIGHHMVCEERNCEKTNIKGLTTSLVIHSTLLAHVMKSLFGRVSYEKTMPDWVLQAPDEFVKGLVDSYICGDGTIEKKSGRLSAGSCSKELLIRFSTLLTRYKIFSKISQHMPELGKFDSVKMQYTLLLTVGQTAKFTQNFTLSMVRKQEILDYHFNLMLKSESINKDMTEDVIWDPIKSIKEITPLNDWVYDLTVAETRNFMSHSGHVFKDTFHLAGVAAKSNMTRGVPRLKELLKVTQNPKATSLTVFLKPEFRTKKEKAREVAQDLELTLLRDITVKAAIYYDPRDDETILPEDRELLNFYKVFESPAEGPVTTWSKWILRLELDRERLFNKNITMDDIAYVLENRFQKEINTVYTDFNAVKLVMRLRITTKDDTTLDDLTSLKKFQNQLLNSVVIRGVPGIKAVSFRKEEEYVENVEGEYKAIQQYVLDTDGSNFLEVMCHPAVDGARLNSTHVHDIYENLGIEATRQVLLNEISELFEEAGVNSRHLGLLCDVMTRAGRLMSVDRYGINKNDIGPIAKASFEETERILLRAALFGEIDPVTGVSANIMMGQPIRGGTSFSQILLDESALQRLMEGLPPLAESDQYDEEEAEAPTQEEVDAELYVDPNDVCSSTQMKMNVTMPPAATLMEEPEMELHILEGEA
jgi:DNA-directed RNA polymerase beta' subunit